MTNTLLRTGAAASPVLLFGYGTLRLIDGLDGHHDKGAWMWNAGHWMFLVALALLGAVAVAARAVLPYRDRGNRLTTDLGVLATLAGTAAFLWVIIGDLFPSWPDLPGPLSTGGPILFQLGLLTVLIQLVRARFLPAWGPVAVLFAFLMIAVNLDLIPLAATLLFAGLYPLTGFRRPVSAL